MESLLEKRVLALLYILLRDHLPYATLSDVVANHACRLTSTTDAVFDPANLPEAIALLGQLKSEAG